MGKGSRLIALLCWTALVTAADSPAAASSNDICRGAAIAELPVVMEGRRPLVKATVNGAKSAFLVDSGAIFSMISPASAGRLGLALRPVPRSFSMAGIGGTVDAQVATVRRFEVAGRTLFDVDFFVGGSEVGATGLLGQNVLGIADAEYDLAGGMVRLLRAGACADRALRDGVWHPFPGMDIEPLTPRQRHISGIASLNGIALRAVFDTGAPTTLLSLAAARRAGIRPGDSAMLPGGAANGLGGSIAQSWVAPGVHYRIGNTEIRGDVLRIADIGEAPFDLLIGADFFLAHRVYVANSRRKLYFTPVAEARNVQAQPALADAEAYSRRGAALAARRELANAIADFSRAIEMAPNEPRYRLQRATARLEHKEDLLAKADLDQAIEMKPDFVAARLSRAVLRVAEKNFALARTDLDAGSGAASREDDRRFAFAALYAGMEDWRRSLEEFDLWIATHPGDHRQAPALNARCWARAMLNEALRQALDDCNAALRLRPDEPAFLDSRATVLLRMGQLVQAIVDYDAALAQQPGLAWSRYGRGLAKLRKGLAAAGREDLTAAVAIDPSLPEKAEKHGVILSAGDPR